MEIYESMKFNSDVRLTVERAEYNESDPVFGLLSGFKIFLRLDLSAGFSVYERIFVPDYYIQDAIPTIDCMDTDAYKTFLRIEAGIKKTIVQLLRKYLTDNKIRWPG